MFYTAQKIHGKVDLGHREVDSVLNDWMLVVSKTYPPLYVLLADWAGADWEFVAKVMKFVRKKLLVGEENDLQKAYNQKFKEVILSDI
jgi:hypothetical protein